jgi:hypothetical protein
MIKKQRLLLAVFILFGIILLAGWNALRVDHKPSEIADAINSTITADAIQDPITPLVTKARPLGLLEDPGHLKNVPDVSFNTVWIMVDAHGYLRIYAGYLASDPEQGILAVVQEYDWQTYPYLLPEKEGELRIVGFENEKLNLVTALGTTWFFDVETRTFLAGNQE